MMPADTGNVLRGADLITFLRRDLGWGPLQYARKKISISTEAFAMTICPLLPVSFTS